jgi:hypothetical protein
MSAKSCANYYNSNSLLPGNVAKWYWMAGKLVTATEATGG